MTKEELEKEATAYALEWGEKTDGTYACCKDGYLAAAEPREKRIAELEAQIEKMKCCFNCKHSRTEYKHCRTDKQEKWEMKENG